MDNAEFSTNLNALAELIRRGDVELALERLLELRVDSSSRAQADELIAHLEARRAQDALALIERLTPAPRHDDIASLSLDLMDELDDWLNLGDFADSPAENDSLHDSSLELVGSEDGFGDLGGLSQAELAQAPDENLLDMFEDMSEPTPSIELDDLSSPSNTPPQQEPTASLWSTPSPSSAPSYELEPDLELDELGELDDIEELEDLDLPQSWSPAPQEPAAPSLPAQRPPDSAPAPSAMFEDFEWSSSGSYEPLERIDDKPAPHHAAPPSPQPSFDADSSPFSQPHHLPQPESLHLSDLFEDDLDDVPMSSSEPLSPLSPAQEPEPLDALMEAPQAEPQAPQFEAQAPLLDLFEDELEDDLADEELAKLSSVVEPEEDVSFILESIASLEDVSSPELAPHHEPEPSSEALDLPQEQLAPPQDQEDAPQALVPPVLPIPATYNHTQEPEDRLTVDWDDWDRDISLAQVDEPKEQEQAPAVVDEVKVDLTPDSAEELLDHEDDDAADLLLAPENVLGQSPQPEAIGFQAPNWAEVFSEPVSISEPVDPYAAPSPVAPNDLEELDALFDLELSSDPDDAASQSQVPSFALNDDDDDLFPGDFSLDPQSSGSQERFETTQLSGGAYVDPHGDVTSLAPAWGKSDAPLLESESELEHPHAEPEPVVESVIEPVIEPVEQLPIASSYIGVESDGPQELSFDLDFDDLEDAPQLSEVSQGRAPWELDSVEDAPQRPHVMTPTHDRPTRQLDAVTAQTLERQYESLDQEAAEEEDDLFAPLGSSSSPRASFDDVLAQEPSDEFDFELEPYTGHMGTVQRESPVFDSLPSYATEQAPDSKQPQAQAQAEDEFDFDLSWEPPQAMPTAQGATRPFESPQTPGNPGGVSGAPLHAFDRQKTPPANALKPEILRQLANTAEHKGVSGTVFGLPTAGFSAVRPQESVESLPEDEFFELAESLANEQSSAHLDRRRYRGEPMLRADSSSPGPFTRQHSEPEPVPVVRENPFAHEAPTGVREPLPDSVKQSYSGNARPDASFELEEVPSRSQQGQPFVRKASAVLSGAPSALKRAQRAFEEGRLDQALALVDEHLTHGPDSEGEAFRVKIIDEQEREQLRILGSLSKTPQLRVGLHELAQMNLDHRFGFVMSQIDGMMTFEDILDISHMPRLETISLLVMMLEKGIISTS